MARQLPILDPFLHPDTRVDPTAVAEKQSALSRDLAQRVRDGVLVAFSGGMDSAFLLWSANEAAVSHGGKVVALTTTSPSTPDQDRDDAMAFTERMDLLHIWRESREIADPRYLSNDRDRCYHCKTELFRIADEVAREEGVRWLLYGYNASDHDDDRPGHRAAREADVVAPLSDAGLTKPEIRYLMMEAGLPLAGKPASPCLSSRIMTGIPITPRRLEDVQAMESILREGGVETLRVRICEADDGAEFLRVEVSPREMVRVLECREELQKESDRRGYRWLTLDLGGYRTGGGVT